MLESVVKALLWFLAGGAVVLLLLGLGLYAFQRNLLYESNAERAEIAKAGLAGLEEITVTTEDGLRLVVWHVPPHADQPVLLYMHGNKGNHLYPPRLDRIRRLAQAGFGLLIVNYRGYGGSEGRPHEAGLHLDARALHGEGVRRYGAERLVAFGESLGSGVAARLALTLPVQALVMEAAYTSVLGAVTHRMPWMPQFVADLILVETFRTDLFLARIPVPILLLHGEQDGIIPVAHAYANFQRAPEHKRLVVFTHAGGHRLMTDHAGTQFLVNIGHESLHLWGATAELQAFLDAVRAGKPPRQEQRILREDSQPTALPAPAAPALSPSG